mmetsp:Transcript_41759/g.131673  ORF Transcript_41759/g.131673 Transcript_41759/m.131673 type:complete len:217 (-) Transcript_41759:473-1123(-)
MYLASDVSRPSSEVPHSYHTPLADLLLHHFPSSSSPRLDAAIELLQVLRQPPLNCFLIFLVSNYCGQVLKPPPHLLVRPERLSPHPLPRRLVPVEEGGDGCWDGEFHGCGQHSSSCSSCSSSLLLHRNPVLLPHHIPHESSRFRHSIVEILALDVEGGEVEQHVFHHRNLVHPLPLELQLEQLPRQHLHEVSCAQQHISDQLLVLAQRCPCEHSSC